ncbi:unnamed protein product [Alopecurus aequalis]
MAGKEDVKLLGLAVSPFVVRVRLALHMKGVSHEYNEQDLFDKGELLLKSNPVHKKVPVLIHDGRPICESLAIVQYIDEFWGTTAPLILPADPYERAIARFWAAYADGKLLPAWVGIMWAATEDERAERFRETLEAIRRLEDAFAQCSDGKPFFAGDSVGYLDLAVGSQLFWFEAVHMMFGLVVLDADKTPLLVAWAQLFGETDAAKAVVPDAATAVEYLKRLQAFRAGSTVAQLLS